MTLFSNNNIKPWVDADDDGDKQQIDKAIVNS